MDKSFYKSRWTPGLFLERLVYKKTTQGIVAVHYVPGYFRVCSDDQIGLLHIIRPQFGTFWNEIAENHKEAMNIILQTLESNYWFVMQVAYGSRTRRGKKIKSVNIVIELMWSSWHKIHTGPTQGCRQMKPNSIYHATHLDGEQLQRALLFCYTVNTPSFPKCYQDVFWATPHLFCCLEPC